MVRNSDKKGEIDESNIRTSGRRGQDSRPKSTSSSKERKKKDKTKELFDEISEQLEEELKEMDKEKEQEKEKEKDKDKGMDTTAVEESIKFGAAEEEAEKDPEGEKGGTASSNSASPKNTPLGKDSRMEPSGKQTSDAAIVGSSNEYIMVDSAKEKPASGKEGEGLQEEKNEKEMGEMLSPLAPGVKFLDMGQKIRNVKGLDRSIQRMDIIEEEYRIMVEANEQYLPPDFFSTDRQQTDILDLDYSVPYYCLLLDSKPDQFKTFFKPDDGIPPWEVLHEENVPADMEYLIFRSLFGLFMLELTSLILGKQLDICLQMEIREQKWRFRPGTEREVLLWKWATPFNYMMLDWRDFKDRLLKFKTMVWRLRKGAREDRDIATKRYLVGWEDIVQRYDTRKQLFESKSWLKRRGQALRGHKGIQRDNAFPYMLIRNRDERARIQNPTNMVDMLKCSRTMGFMEHTETDGDLLSLHVESKLTWNDKDYTADWKGPEVERRLPDEDDVNEENKAWRLENMRVARKGEDKPVRFGENVILGKGLGRSEKLSERLGRTEQLGKQHGGR